MIVCANCETENREIARFCKRCGSDLVAANDDAAGAGDPILGNLVGLDHIRGELEEIVNVIKGMQEDGNLVRMNYNLILIGNSGTAKSLIGDLFFAALKRLKILSAKNPHALDAGDFKGLDKDKLEGLVKNAKGGMIVIDNAQELIVNGDAVPPLKRLLVEMDKTGGDPIVLLGGLPKGLREFVASDENSNFTGRFRKVFLIDDYSSETLQAIVTRQLAVKYGFSVGAEAQEKLSMRCRFLSKEMKNPDANLGAFNGYLALKETDSLVHNYYLRGGTGKEITPDDIRGEIFEKRSAEEILARLEQFVGMEVIKKDIRQIYDRMALEAAQGKTAELNLHAVLTGNPGTGKTTVVRTLGEIYNALGVLDVGHVVEVDRSKLVAGYLGQTAIQVNTMVDKALGGVLFVDEAYALAQGDNDSFGQEAIDTLLKRVEDDRGKFCCIVAGYRDEMHDFLSSNPGLESRFPKRFHLEDYSADELYQIFALNMKQEGYSATAEAEKRIRDYFADRVARKSKDFANGREARNLFEGAKGRLGARLAAMPDPDPSDTELLTRFVEEDIPSLRQEGGITLEEAMGRLEALTGLASVKSKVRELIDTLETDRLRGAVRPLAEHFCFVGNPGTGKTTVARIFADVLYAAGLIPNNKLLEADRSALVGSYSGQTAPKVNDLVDRAIGGVLFIDEAYNLYQDQNDGFGREAINTLLKRIEDDRGKFICIVAGYKKEMHDFLQSNSGLKSRFTTTIEFEDYSADEMTSIFLSMAAREGYQLTSEAKEAAAKLFEGRVARKTKDFGNARDVRKVFEATRGKLSKRIMAIKQEGADEETLKGLVNRIEAKNLPVESAAGTDLMEKALARLEKQVGLASVKTKVRSLIDQLEVQKIRGREKPLSIHFIFSGNPGTGKTTVARILADIFYTIGLLPSNNLVEADRAAMVGEYMGHTATKTNNLVDRAMGGVLFVDEAYALKQRNDDSFGQEAVDTLLKRMEDDRGKFIVIAAGYKREMERFLNSNTGLKSRFSDTINFEDYSGEELAQIFSFFADQEGYQLGEGVETRTRDYFDGVYQSRDENFGNARTVRQYFAAVLGNQSRRLMAMKQAGTVGEAELKQEANLIAVEDLTVAEGQR